MTPTDLAQRIVALDWSATSLQHQLVIGAAVTTLRGLPSQVCGCCGDQWRDGMSCGQKDNGWPFETCYPTAYLPATTSPLPDGAIDAVVVPGAPVPPAPDCASNVHRLPPPAARTRWTTICHLDGREWARSSHFGPSGAWDWIVESVQEEWGVRADQVGSLEGVEDQWDGNDVVTIDGVPSYRIQTAWC